MLVRTSKLTVPMLRNPPSKFLFFLRSPLARNVRGPRCLGQNRGSTALQTGISQERLKKVHPKYVPTLRGDGELLIAAKNVDFRPSSAEKRLVKGQEKGLRGTAGRRVFGGSGVEISGENGSCQSRSRSFLDRFGSNFRVNQVRRVLSLHRTLRKSKNGSGTASNGQEKAANGTDRDGAGRDRRYRRGRR